jgi:hypothetical protein
MDECAAKGIGGGSSREGKSRKKEKTGGEGGNPLFHIEHLDAANCLRSTCQERWSGRIGVVVNVKRKTKRPRL